MNPFKVGDRVRCVDSDGTPLVQGDAYTITHIHIARGSHYVAVCGIGQSFLPSRFELVQPERPVLDPWAWDLKAMRVAVRWSRSPSYMEDFTAWARFCCWATSVDLAAHFLPTTPAARTRASNGRDVPVTELAVMLPVWKVQAWASDDWSVAFDRADMAAACRRALTEGEGE